MHSKSSKNSGRDTLNTQLQNNMVLRGGRIVKWKGQAGSLPPMASEAAVSGILGKLNLSPSKISLALALAITGTLGAASAIAAEISHLQPAVSLTGAPKNLNMLIGNVFFVPPSELTQVASTSVTGTGNAVLSLPQDGIYEYVLPGETTDINVTTDNAYGSRSGIYTFNEGSGSTSITATGTVRGDSTYGVYAYGAGTDIDINANNVYGGAFGVFVFNTGSGATNITTTGSVTGSRLDGVYAYTYGNGIAIETAEVRGNRYGIYAGNVGSGNIDIVTNGEISSSYGDGIRATSSSSDGGVNITTNALVSGGRYGINVENSGNGSTNITANGRVEGYGGISATNTRFTDSTDITITVNGGIDARTGSAIIALNYGTGEVDISASADITGDFNGIYALTGLEGTDLTITSSADIEGTRASGITARNVGSGSANISVGNVTGGFDGIYGYVSTYGTDLHITATGTVIGTARLGISAVNYGNGIITVDANNVYSDRYGIFARNRYEGTGITVTATGNVEGTSRIGILAGNYGSGDTIVTANNVTGGIFGIFASGLRYSSNVTVTTTGDVIGSTGFGIFTQTLGSGAINIQANNVTGATTGIYARNIVYGTDINITASGNITGTSGQGIFAKNYSSGKVDISVNNVSGGTEGIYASNSRSGTDLSIHSTGSISGGTGEGIDARNYGSGALDINVAGDINSMGASGILAYNSSNGTSLTINANNVSGFQTGILAANLGSGALSITAAGNVTGTTSDGVNANNSSNGTDLTVDVGSASGGLAGIFTENYGSGALTITATGHVSGAADDGVYAYNSANGTNLTVEVGSASGYYDGIDALNFGSGHLTITATGDVSGTYGNGISARNYGTNLVINAASVSGYYYGIRAVNNGIGQLAITSTGIVVGGQYGIFANTGANSTHLNIDTYAVGGGVTGIAAVHNGAGNLNITNTGAVLGLGDNNNYYGVPEGAIVAINNGQGGTTINVNDIYSNGYGIFAVNGSSTTGGLSITATGDIDAGNGDGIDARNFGSNALNIDVTGAVTSEYGNGIFAYNSSNGTNLTINASDVSGFGSGVIAVNYGSEHLAVTTTGHVSGTNVDGVYANNSANGTSLTVAVGSASGGLAGIHAENYGSGALAIMASGHVSGTTEDGVYAYNSANGTGLTVNVGSASGGNDGINALNLGSGHLVITATGNVTGMNGSGISAENQGAGSNLIINAANVDGGIAGINAVNTGQNLLVTAHDVTGTDYGISAINIGPANGTVIITATGTVEAGAGTAYGTGIYARNDYYGTGLTINSVNVTGGATGIAARLDGAGILDINATGTTTGGSVGIIARAGAISSHLTIDANNVSGGDDGINAVHNGTGNLNITSTGHVSGTSGDGIYASNSASGAGLTINAHDITGARGAINATQYGSGTLGITVTGTVRGGSRGAIYSYTYTNGQTNITLQNGANVSSDNGVAIYNNDGNSHVMIKAGSTVSGEILLNGGVDIVTFAGGDFSGLTLVDGGDESNTLQSSAFAATANPVDILNFNLTGSDEINSDILVGFEQLNINSGTLRFSNAEITIDEFNINGGGRLDAGNSLTVNAPITIADGGHLFGGNAAGNSNVQIFGNLSNTGSINLGSASGTSVAGDRLTLEGDYVGTAGSLLIFDVALGGNGSAADQLVINGNVTGSSRIAVNNASGRGGLTTGDGIQILQVNGDVEAGAFSLAGPVNVGAFAYSLAIGSENDPNDGRLFLQSNVRAVALPVITIARASQEIGLAFLGTVNERIGEIRSTGVETGGAKGIWGRVIGKTGDETLTSSAIGGIYSESNLGGLQLGFDAYNYVSDSGAQTNIGVYAGYAWSGFEDYFRQSPREFLGKTNSDGWLAGIYATHYRPSGLYLNAVIQGNWLDHKATALGGTQLNTDSSEYTFSLEAGQSFKLRKGLKIEPQVQFIYGTTDVDDSFDNVGVEGELDVKDTFTGRGGFRLVSDNGKALDEKGYLSFYSKANLWHRLSGGGVTAFATASPVNVDPRKTWADVGLGLGYKLNKDITLFADSDVEFGLDKQATSYTGKLGFRINW